MGNIGMEITGRQTFFDFSELPLPHFGGNPLADVTPKV